ncbi:MAG: hypothetical protein HY235_26000 [Acidobacteria bacterium]|nr:hypothetical protein [Acidobacteriota bacterium]
MTDGMVCRGSDGIRLILIASNLQMIYLHMTAGRVYAQDTTSFIQEMNAFPMTEAGRRALGMMRLSQAVVGLLLGLASTALPGALIIGCPERMRS